ncbi:MAG: 30S ribosomal protein S12 methylthiotransferase RimO [Chitinispirillaceae bacterium]|nr:30S ribosomal protein S12 methylthiotransferase RimO [Chitinispirillaceae bacterium]
MAKIALVNLGCSKNIIDGEKILYFFKEAGYTVTNELSRADVIVVNTCSFIKEAKEEAIDNILTAAEAKKYNKYTKLIVAGCFSERFRKEVASEFPEVDLWIGVNDWEKTLSDFLSCKDKNNSQKESNRILTSPLHTQYLKIAEGCSHRCSFCIIPFIRGKYKSREPKSILEEAKWLEEKGVKELILVAQDTSFYGRDIGINLVYLLERLTKNCHFPWIRLMYLHPQFVNDSLIDFIAAEKRICPYFDIPLQHISQPILDSMKRKPSSKEIYKLIEKIRVKLPEAAIRTAFIVGYPGEKKSHFQELLNFIEWAKFDRLGVFPYSREEGTPAEKFKPRPRDTTVQKRCEIIMLTQREISRELNEKKAGKILEVIIDGKNETNPYLTEGRTKYDAPEVDGKVFIKNCNNKAGEIVKVKIIKTDDYDLYGEIVLEK